MIDINSIIHIPNQAFEIDKHTAVLCLQDYKRQAGAYEFKKDNLYSIEFAKSVGTVINNFTLTCTKQKHAFKIITKTEIQTPTITLQEIQEQALENEPQETQETEYRFEVSGYKQKDGSAFKKGKKYTETEIKEAGLDIEELLNKEAITWLK